MGTTMKNKKIGLRIASTGLAAALLASGALSGLGSANAVGTETLAGAAAPAADEQEMRDTGGPVFPRFPGPRIRPIVPALASQRATAVVKLESWE